MGRADARRRTPAHCARAVEAAVYLTISRIAIRFLAFRRLVRAFTRRVRRRELTGPARARAIADVRRAVTAAAARLPGRTACFPRATAAQAMLRCRGVGTTLYYGATTSLDRSLRAHVWLYAGDEGVVGQEIASLYPVLAVYSTSGAGTITTGRTI